MRKLAAVLLIFALSSCAWLQQGGTYAINAGQTGEVVADLIEQYDDIALIVNSMGFSEEETKTVAVMNVQFQVLIDKLKGVKEGELITADEFFEIYDTAKAVYDKGEALVTPRFDSLPDESKVALAKFDAQAKELTEKVEWLDFP